MAFQAFNFGKRIGLVGTGNSSSKSEPASGKIEIPVIDTYAWTGGERGQWSRVQTGWTDSSPLDPGTTTYGWVLNEGDEPRRREVRQVGGGGYAPEEVPRVIQTVAYPSNSESSGLLWIHCEEDPYDCSTSVKQQVTDFVLKVLSSKKLDDKFNAILSCINNDALKNLRFGCCRNKPRPSLSAYEFDWEKEIVKTGNVWLDPDNIQEVDIMRALLQLCPGFDGKRTGDKADVLAYLMISIMYNKKPPCKDLEQLIKFRRLNYAASQTNIKDKYINWDYKTGKITFINPDGSVSEEALNKGDEDWWKCLMLDMGWYDCCQ